MIFFRNLKTQKFLKNFLKYLALFCVLSLPLALIFYSPETTSATITQDCATLDPNITTRPGNNCLFKNLPLCNLVPTPPYYIDQTDPTVLNTSGIHRYSCNDLSDMPLCSDVGAFNGATVLPGKNCAELCSSISSGVGTRGTDFAVHNRDCVRFCDAMESGMTANEGINCINKNCHQTTTGVTAASTCTNLPCNLLSPEELAVVATKTDNDIAADPASDKRYCNGSEDITGKSLKCYKFTKEQLPYVIKSKECVVNKCVPSCANYRSATDENGDGLINTRDDNDTLNISDRDINGITDPDTSYVEAYKTYINNGFDLNSGSSPCTQVICKPIAQKPFRCTDANGAIQGDNRDTVRNDQCDATGSGATCTNNFCYKTIDCNDPANSGQAECVTHTDDGSIDYEDDTLSWMLRPRPHNTALNGNKILRANNADDLCYTKGEMLDNGWGEEPKTTIDFGLLGKLTINLGYMHSFINPDFAVSPGYCESWNDIHTVHSGTKDGSRGNGYIYLCYGDGNPNGGQLYSKVSDETAYYSGYTSTVFTGSDAEYSVRLCLRFRNAMRPDDGKSETCGARECAITCLFGACNTQACGYDVCKTLSLKESNSGECAMSGLVDNPGNGKRCAQVIDDYLRLRIQKYGNRICGFLDVKGQTAYDNGSSVSDLFVRGNAALSSGACVSGGSPNGSGECSGHDNYDQPSSASVWRTIRLTNSGNIPYIKDNRGTEPKGFIDYTGKLQPEQDCIKVPLRVAPPMLYNLANANNSTPLFSPPLYIENTLTREGSNVIAPAQDGEDLGMTDFLYPAMRVRFGNVTADLSLDINNTGYETLDRYEKSFTELTATINEIEFPPINIFVRKEFNLSTQKPTFCLYRQETDGDGAKQDIKIACINRSLPPLSITAAGVTRSTAISAPASNTFDKSAISIKYLDGANQTSALELKFFDNNGNPTMGTICSDTYINPADNLVKTPQLYKLCAKREECSELNVECVLNEINLQAARVASLPLDSYTAIKNRCDNYLLPLCNAKKGITTPSGVSIISFDPNQATASPTAYGWFNEICLVGDERTTQSLDHELKTVLAYKTVTDAGGNKVKGKCAISPLSPGYGTPACDAGGKAPNCKCIIADAFTDADYDTSVYEIRKQTTREAGLCIDMPKPETCSAITYNSSGKTWGEIEASSIGQNAYGATQSNFSGVVHLAFKHASIGDGIAGSVLDGVGHADFPIALLGSVDITGTCRGFWRQSGSRIPSRTCKNVSGTAVWDSTVKNACIRYSCPEQLTVAGLDVATGLYDYGYASGESGEAKGTSDGFAKWPLTTKTTDFLENVGSTGCIPGFKKIGSTAQKAGDTITSYSGGTTPTRNCNQKGIWQSVSNACQRITCSAINPPTGNPAGSYNNLSSSDWAKWYASGGATYPQIDASRSVNTGNTATGTCINDLGFFNLGAAPTRECDYLGNWGPVINPCTTRCSAVSDAYAGDSNNGFATWAQADIPSGQSELAGSFIACKSDYVKYPYPPLKNKYGEAYDLARGAISASDYTFSPTTPTTIAGTATSPYTTAIPLDVSTDTRTPGNPQKYCRAVSHDGVIANNWEAADSSCINACPGFDTDPRVGVGVTKHNTRTGIKMLRWPAGSFNKWYYHTSTDDGSADPDNPNLGTLSAANFSDITNPTSGRTNGSYVVARYCNSDGKWSDPVPQCATNGVQANDTGIIQEASTTSNAVYSGSTRGTTKTVDVGTNATTTTCRSGNYYPTGSDGTAQPISSYSCSYMNGNTNIDQVYFKKVSGSPCAVYCPVPAVNTIYGNNKYVSGASAYTAVGNKITLACKDSTVGKAPDANAATSDNNCGITNPARGNANPQVECLSDGTFGNVTRNCTACADCPNSLAATNPNGVTSQYSKGDYGRSNCNKYDQCTITNTFNTTCAPFLSHNTSTTSPTCDVSGSCHVSYGDYCDDWYHNTSSFTVTCKDGISYLSASAD